MIDFEALEFFFAKEKKYTFYLPLKENVAVKILEKPKQVQAEYKKENLPPPLEKKTETKKESFYSEWEKKYKALAAGNLLSKEPFKKLALFIINKKSDEEFAEKISLAINSRLMKTIFLISDAPLDELIKIHDPTHIITTKSVTNFIPLPGLLIDNLKKIEKSAEEKKQLWENLKTCLRG
jgi:hypothetical protein